MQLYDQRVLNQEQVRALAVGSAINAFYGTTSGLITRPAKASLLVLKAEKGNWRIRIGRYTAFTFTAATTDICTATAHSMKTGHGPVRLTTSGTLPAGLALTTDYWIVRLTDNTFNFASSAANAEANTPVIIDITDTGSGTHTIADGMPAVDAVGAAISNGSGGWGLVEGKETQLPGPSFVTVKGFAADSALSYYWI